MRESVRGRAGSGRPNGKRAAHVRCAAPCTGPS